MAPFLSTVPCSDTLCPLRSKGFDDLWPLVNSPSLSRPPASASWVTQKRKSVPWLTLGAPRYPPRAAMAAPREDYGRQPQDFLRNLPSNQTCAYRNNNRENPLLAPATQGSAHFLWRVCHSWGEGICPLLHSCCLFPISNKHKNKVTKRRTTACLKWGSHQALTCKSVPINYGVVNSEPEGKQQKLVTIPALCLLKTSTSKCGWFLTF